MRKVYFRPQAEADLVALYDYIVDQAGERIATGYLDRIEALCATLATFPERGVPRDDLVRGMRTIAMERRTIITYRALRNHIEVVAVLYGGRDIESILKGGR